MDVLARERFLQLTPVTFQTGNATAFKANGGLDLSVVIRQLQKKFGLRIELERNGERICARLLNHDDFLGHHAGNALDLGGGVVNRARISSHIGKLRRRTAELGKQINGRDGVEKFPAVFREA